MAPELFGAHPRADDASDVFASAATAVCVLVCNDNEDDTKKNRVTLFPDNKATLEESNLSSMYRGDEIRAILLRAPMVQSLIKFNDFRKSIKLKLLNFK